MIKIKDPKKIAGYRVIERCGDKTRPVYLAENLETKELAVLKRNNPFHFSGLRGISESEARRTSILALEHEREILDHLYSRKMSGICEVLDWIEDKDAAYLVLNYVPGKEINNFFEYSLEDKLKIIKGIAQILDYAHKRKVIHRDITPSNVLVDADLDTTLLDWSLSYHCGNDRWNPSTFSGTIEFMSPQQAAGFKPETMQDVYPLSLVSLGLLTQKHISEFKWNDQGNLVYPKFQTDTSFREPIELLVAGCNHREEGRPELERLIESIGL